MALLSKTLKIKKCNTSDTITDKKSMSVYVTCTSFGAKCLQNKILLPIM